MKNIFDSQITNEVIERISKLTPETKADWGKMDVAQMLAHTNVTYDYVYTDRYKKPKGLKKWMVIKLIKPFVVGEKPFKKNGSTAPDFKMKNSKNFEEEKKKLIENLKKTQELGATHFDGKESHSFGILNEKEWNIMFYKHLDHHLSQFGV